MSSENYTIVITDSNFQSEVQKGELPLVLEFWAEWSGANHILEPILKTLAIRYHGQIKIGKIDIDHNQSTVSLFCVHSVPTILFFKHGQVVDFVSGTVPLKTLEEKILNLLV